MKLLFFLLLSSVLGEPSLEKIDSWLKSQNLNEYGDPEGMMYMGGSPLFDESTGEQTNRLDYLLERFPENSWDVESEF